jgi:hypothetical protein
LRLPAFATASAGLVFLVLLAIGGPGLAEEPESQAGQDLWRSCSSCHCVPDPRIPEDGDWLKLNETTTCISGEHDTPEERKALIAYLRAGTTIRPLLISDGQAAPAGATCGKIRVPSTAGSAYLKAERKSVRDGSPPRIRLSWKESEKGTTLAVPVGEYRVISYAFYRTDEKGQHWAASGSSAEGCAQVTVGGDAEAALELVPEIEGHLTCEEGEDGEGSHVFGFFMSDKGGKRMSLACQGKLVNPSWMVTGAEGQRIDAGDFEVT